MTFLIFILACLFVLSVNTSRSGVCALANVADTAGEEETIDTDTANDDNAEAKAKQPAGPIITPTTWVLSATTHMPKQLPHALAKDLSKQANYVHWTCYRHHATVPTDKLQCCREIYQLQQRDPFHLCWKKQSCGKKDVVGRSEFMHYCTEQIVDLDGIVGLSSDSSTTQSSIPPRFSLLVAPRWPSIPSDTWRQFVSFDTTQGGHWMYEIESAFRLALDPATFFASEEEESLENKDGGEFQATLSSTVLPDPGDDEDFRDFVQTLVVELPADKQGTTNAWTVSLQVLLYLPESAGLRKSKTKPTCRSSAGQCVLELEKSMDDSIGQQHLVKATILLSDLPSSDTTVEWKHSIALDDDNIILPGPFIYTGSATSDLTEGDLTWKPSLQKKIAFPTAIDDHDEL